MSLRIDIQKHKDIPRKQLEEIASLKDQHWPHGIDSQINWILDNYEENDIHLILYREETPVAYASLNVISCQMDSREEEILGLGGVCVDRSCQKQGLGKEIVEAANRYIAQQKMPGLLLCHKELTEFYSRCGWLDMSCGKVTVAGKDFDHCVMSYGKAYEGTKLLEIPKNF